jgi:hypothetical protein
MRHNYFQRKCEGPTNNHVNDDKFPVIDHQIIAVEVETVISCIYDGMCYVLLGLVKNSRQEIE